MRVPVAVYRVTHALDHLHSRGASPLRHLRPRPAAAPDPQHRPFGAHSPSHGFVRGRRTGGRRLRRGARRRRPVPRPAGRPLWPDPGADRQRRGLGGTPGRHRAHAGRRARPGARRPGIRHRPCVAAARRLPAHRAAADPARPGGRACLLHPRRDRRGADLDPGPAAGARPRCRQLDRHRSGRLGRRPPGGDRRVRGRARLTRLAPVRRRRFRPRRLPGLPGDAHSRARVDRRRRSLRRRRGGRRGRHRGARQHRVGRPAARPVGRRIADRRNGRRPPRAGPARRVRARARARRAYLWSPAARRGRRQRARDGGRARARRHGDRADVRRRLRHGRRRGAGRHRDRGVRLARHRRRDRCGRRLGRRRRGRRPRRAAGGVRPRSRCRSRIRGAGRRPWAPPVTRKRSPSSRG